MSATNKDELFAAIINWRINVGIQPENKQRFRRKI